MSAHLKFPVGSIVMLKKLERRTGNVITIWGGKVLRSEPGVLTVLAIEMVNTGAWHAAGKFHTIQSPPHRLPFRWDFPRLLSEKEPGADLEAKNVIEAALERYYAENTEAV